jgi:hypothetical protein
MRPAISWIDWFPPLCFSLTWANGVTFRTVRPSCVSFEKRVSQKTSLQLPKWVKGLQIPELATEAASIIMIQLRPHSIGQSQSRKEFRAHTQEWEGQRSEHNPLPAGAGRARFFFFFPENYAARAQSGCSKILTFYTQLCNMGFFGSSWFIFTNPPAPSTNMLRPGLQRHCTAMQSHNKQQVN